MTRSQATPASADRTPQADGPLQAIVVRREVEMTTIYRVQDKDGRGPWKPGFARFWVEPRDDHDNLVPWYVEFGDVHRRAIVGMHMGCGCSSLEKLRRWFTPAEYATLRRAGYQAVQMTAGRILAESAIQCVFERAKPLRIGVEAVELYAHNAEVTGA